LLLKLNIRKNHNKRFFNLKSERAQAQQEIFKPEIRIQNTLLSEGLVIDESGSSRGSGCEGQAAAVAEKRGTGRRADASIACVVYQVGCVHDWMGLLLNMPASQQLNSVALMA
jgi:hypothetical protein